MKIQTNSYGIQRKEEHQQDRALTQNNQKISPQNKNDETPGKQSEPTRIAQLELAYEEARNTTALVRLWMQRKIPGHREARQDYIAALKKEAAAALTLAAAIDERR